MSKNNNYDTKSSILSIDYKIPYDASESSRIVEHLEESQQELEFLKLKLTQVYEKLEVQIKANIELGDQNDHLLMEKKEMEKSWDVEKRQNNKLKQVMHIMLQNRKMLEDEVEYTHRRYKKILQEKQEQFECRCENYEVEIKKLQQKICLLEEQLQSKPTQDSKIVKENRQLKQKSSFLEQQVYSLELQIKKLTSEKVTQVTRLKHQIQCYQRSISPIKQITISENKRPLVESIIQQNKQNQQNQNTKDEKKMEQSNATQSSVGKWKKSKNEISDDQKLTQCQLQKKKVETQLIKLERLKRHTQSDRQLMQDLQHQIYQLDSEISGLKRKIRQKY